MTVINCDKHPADYCVVFDASEVILVFNFVVGYLRVMRVVRFYFRRNFLWNYIMFHLKNMSLIR